MKVPKSMTGDRRRFPSFPNPVRPLTPEEVMAIIVPELIRRVVELVAPTRVILFGSAARGEMRTDSDLDLLVVMPDGSDHKRALDALNYGVRIRFPKDLLVVTEGELKEYGDDPWLIYRQVLAEGKELYQRED